MATPNPYHQEVIQHEISATDLSMLVPIPGAREVNRADLTLPKGFADADMEAFLSQVLDSPGLMSSDALGTPAPIPISAQNTLVSSTEPKPANIPDETQESSIETALALAASDNILGNYPNESGPAGDSSQAILKYEEAQREQLLRLIDMVKPLEKAIGFNLGEICNACFHVGHHSTDTAICPTAHVRSLFSGEQFYDRLPNKKHARDLLMSDIGYTCQGLCWAIGHSSNGPLQQVGIFPGNITQVHSLMKKWNSVCTDENFTLGRFGVMGGELMFGGPVDIPLIPTAHGLYQQKFIRGDIETDANPLGSLIPPNSIARVDPPPTRKEKPECDADRLKLPIIGNRPTTVCTNCFYRGHTKSSTKLCPYGIISQAIEKARAAKRKRKLDNVSREVERLQKVVNGIELNRDSGVEKIVILLAEWQDVVANSLINGVKIDVASSNQLQEKITDISAMPQVHKPADTQTYSLPQGLYSDDPLDPLNSDSVTPPFLETAQSPKNTNSLPYTSDPSATLSLPFGEDSEPGLYDISPAGNSFNFPQELDELGNDQFTNLEGMEGFFGESFGAILADPQSYQISSPPLIAPTEIDESLFSLPHHAQQDAIGSLEVPMSQHTQASTPISQQDPDIDQDMGQSDLDEAPANHELPAMIFWRSRCPLRTIGSRSDNICKNCLHYGHDKRNSACPVNVVREAIATEELHAVLGATLSIQELESAVKWQGQIPQHIRGNISLIQNLVRKWRKLFETLGEAEDHPDIEIHHPDPKNHCTPEKRFPCPPHKQQPQSRIVSMQMDREVQHFAPNVRRSIEGNFSEIGRLDSPQFATVSSQHQKQSYPDSSPQNTNSQQAFPGGQLFSQENLTQAHPQHKQITTPEGVAIDYSRMAPGLFARISGYIIDDNELSSNDRLRVDYQRMPKSLVVDIRQYLFDDSQEATTQQTDMQQQHQLTESHLSGLSSTSQQYNQPKFRAPKRKRN